MATSPDSFDGLAEACATRGLPAHYAVLRTDLQTCLERAAALGPLPEERLLVELHARFEDLGTYEANVIDAARPPDAIASDVLRALAAGDLASRSTAQPHRFP